MPPRIADSVVVVTGASSGIGRATALALARRGASVVLAARSGESLEEVARQCREAGGNALVAITDVSDEPAVRGLARRAHEEFGRIDAWVNAAAVIAYGAFDDIPSEVYRQVIDTNLFGQIHGARAVLPYFRRQGRGVLVNIGSVWGIVSSPFVSPYVVSKFGAQALSECLQEGLALDPGAREIHVCAILPQSVDTPIFRHAANYVGRQVRPVPPVLDPDRVVTAILNTLERPRPRTTVGWSGRLLEAAFALAPGLLRRVVPYAIRHTAFGTEPAATGTGNVLEPMPEWNRVSGRWRSAGKSPAAGAAVAGAVVAGAGAVGALAAARRLRRSGA